MPGGNCACPHWGYVLKGRAIVRYDDHEEVLEAGDAFYMRPGHAPESEAGTELVMISPSEEYDEVEALFATMQDAQGGGSDGAGNLPTALREHGRRRRGREALRRGGDELATLRGSEPVGQVGID